MKQLVLLWFALHTAAAQPKAAHELNDRGLETYNRGDYVGAERLYREAVAKWQALGPEFSPHLGITRFNLGQALSSQGRRTEALTELKESVELLRGSLGPRNTYTLTGTNLLAAVYLMLGNLSAAGSLLEETLPIAREIDPAGIQLARTLDALACLRLRQNRLDEALTFADESLRLTLHASSDDSLDAALAYGTAAEVHRAAGRLDRALPLYRHARDIYEKRLGTQDIRVAAVLAQESLILIGDRKFATAERQLKQAEAIVDHSCPACALERWTVESAFAFLRTRQGKYAEADRLLTHILALQEAAQPQPSASDLADTLNSLAFVRRKERLFEDADRLTHRAATLTFR